MGADTGVPGAKRQGMGVASGNWTDKDWIVPESPQKEPAPLVPIRLLISKTVRE